MAIVNASTLIALQKSFKALFLESFMTVSPDWEARSTSLRSLTCRTCRNCRATARNHCLVCLPRTTRGHNKTGMSNAARSAFSWRMTHL